MKSHKPLKWAGVILGVLVAGLASAQLVRPERANLTTDPTHTLQANLASSGAGAVLDRARGAYSPEQQRAFLVASCSDARAGRMPMPAYLRFRPDAKLSSRDIETICGASR